MSTDFYFGKTSKSNLEGVHPDLIKVAKLALKYSDYDFGVSEGVRSIDRQREMVRDGNSKTMLSNHLVQKDGYSHAIDVYAYINGKASYRENYMKHIAKCFYRAAIELGIQIEWGGMWVTLDDMPHFQLGYGYRF